MFLPNGDLEREQAERQEAYKRIEEWTKELLGSDQLKNSCTVSVQEIACGDPSCSPIDTFLQLIFEAGGEGAVGIPSYAKNVTRELLKASFPPRDIIDKWYRGEEANWPPEPEPIELRFSVGTHVLCRVGAHQWAPGTVEQLWYRQFNWEEGVFAPYKIKLRDGRSIYAPQDVDPIIKLDPDANQQYDGAE